MCCLVCERNARGFQFNPPGSLACYLRKGETERREVRNWIWAVVGITQILSLRLYAEKFPLTLNTHVVSLLNQYQSARVMSS